MVKNIKVQIDKDSTAESIKCIITVSYTGTFDSVVVNVQILDSNELIIFKSYNDKIINQNVSRLFIPAKDIDGIVRVETSLGYIIKESQEIKFRASIIEQHKEIESDIAFIKIES